MRRGSLSVVRRIEQAVGRLMLHYAVRYKAQEGVELNPTVFMPHEDQPKPKLGIFDFDEE